MIPKIIHQVWLGATDPEPPATFAAASESWRTANKGWEHRRWTGTQIEALFASVRPDLLDLYRRYPYWVEKADAARYLILHELGGVYADFDIVCLRSLDDFIDSEAVLARVEPRAVSNDLMMARPGHPLFKTALDQLPGSFRRWHQPWIPRHFRILCATGSLHLTRVFRSFAGKRGVRLLTSAEYGHGDLSEAFVRHIEGNSWAAWDTHVFVFLAKHWRMLIIGAAVLAGWIIATR